MTMRVRWRYSLALVPILGLALVGWGYLNREGLRYVMARWTGESNLQEQIKGTLALAYLRLTRLPPRTDPFVPIAHTGVSPYGVNTFLEQEVEVAKVERSLRLISEAGFRWIRQEFPWEDIEISGKGDYWDPKWNISTWEKYDRLVALAEKYGLQIIARLDNPPGWTRRVGDPPAWTLAPPDNFEDYGDFVYTVVSRYRGRIRYYQIWNEPNIYPEWGDQPADPAGYVRLLQIAYRRAKQADPDCVILSAGLAQTTEETPPEFGPRNMSDLLYLERMYQAGVKGYFDIMGAMVYGLWTGPYDRRTSRDRANFSRVQLLREIMVHYGDADKAIWATEVGWNATPQDFSGVPSYGRVSELDQAIYAVQAYRRAAREWPWMGVMNYWFLRRPSDAEVNQAWYYFRMLEPDFTPLPVYETLSWLANQPPTVHSGYHQEDHWALHYVGDWRRVRDEGAILGAYALGGEGAELNFHFEGTDLALVLRDAREIERLEIGIDAGRSSPRRLWNLSTRGPYSMAITVARGLPDARHRAYVRVREGTVALDGIIVWRRGPSVWPWVMGLGALGALCGSAANRRAPRPRELLSRMRAELARRINA